MQQDRRMSISVHIKSSVLVVVLVVTSSLEGSKVIVVLASMVVPNENEEETTFVSRHCVEDARDAVKCTESTGEDEDDEECFLLEDLVGTCTKRLVCNDLLWLLVVEESS